MQTTTHPALLSTDKSNSTRKSNLVTRIQAVKTSDRLSPSARLLLRSIADYCGNDSSCWPSCRRLATECGLSVRHVQRLLGELEAQGWIARGARHRDDGGQRSNLIRWTHQSATPAAQPARACHPPLHPRHPLKIQGKHKHKKNIMHHAVWTKTGHQQQNPLSSSSSPQNSRQFAPLPNPCLRHNTPSQQLQQLSRPGHRTHRTAAQLPWRQSSVTDCQQLSQLQQLRLSRLQQLGNPLQLSPVRGS